MDYSYFAQPAPSYSYIGLPPTPAESYPTQAEVGKPENVQYHTSDSFQDFGNQSFNFDPDAFPAPPPPASPPHSLHRPSLANGLPGDNSFNNGDYDNNDIGNGRSSSEEKEILTPAQSRRKAQNRAAQRAFRERKERHVKDLEVKLNSLEAHSSTLLTDNERLKRELQKLATQNEILRATSSTYHQPSTASSSSTHLPTITTNNNHNGNNKATDDPTGHASLLPGPQTYTPTDFHSAMGIDITSDHPISNRIHRSPDTGEKLLAAGATWDMIQGHELYRKGMVDVADVSARLKGKSVCDGTGPAFREGEVRRAIEESVAGGSDELI